jgi:hypothetical protein
MDARGVLIQIPRHKTGNMRVSADHSQYTLRPLVERHFNKRANARRIATRYDRPRRSSSDS